MQRDELLQRLANSCLAFRGYDQHNLGRTHEFLLRPRYAGTMIRRLDEASEICRRIVGRPIDLASRVAKRDETTVACYDEAVALVVAVSLAQLDIAREQFGCDFASARLAFGYSLGEITALVAGGVWDMREALRIPLELASDCVALADGVTLGVLFSRAEEIPFDDLRRQCLLVNQEGRGVVGISAYLSPNTALVMGQLDTLDRLLARAKQAIPDHLHLRKNDGTWPPMHTPLVWDRNIPNRAARLMHTMSGGFTAPTPPVLSLVTGKQSYNDFNAREHLQQWTDHPQRLWDAVHETLALGIDTVIHVGPAPHIIPATFKRLRSNIESRLQASMGMRALSSIVSRPWLRALLPRQTSLLRAPLVEHILLEDWLLDEAEREPLTVGSQG